MRSTFTTASRTISRGKPDQTLKADGSYATQPLEIHDGCSISGNKLIDTFVIEKGKPLASPAP